MADLLAPQFQDADKAREYLEALRWPDGIVCPHCGVKGNHYRLTGKAHRPGVIKCADCRQQFTVTVGTVFESSRVPLNKWLLAVHLMCASKKAVSSHQIHRMLGVTYKTAWFMTHRIREAMKPDGGGLMGSGGGTVEADETFWGNQGKQRKGARGYAHKMKIVSLVERDGEKRSFHVPNVNGKTLRAVLDANVCKSANLMTDEASAYTEAGKSFASHGVVRHNKGEYASGKKHVNTAESSFSLLKRGLVGTFHHVSEHHLHRYTTEFDFRWNHRKTEDAERTAILLGKLGGRRLRYRGEQSVTA